MNTAANIIQDGLNFPKITASDEAIAEALESASIPCLMASMMYMSGDYSLLDGDIRPGEAVLSEIQGFMSEADKAEIRRRALPIICDYRDRGCTLPSPPDRETAARIMNFVVGAQEPIGDVYLDLMMEEMQLSGKDLRRVEFPDDVTDKKKQQASAVIIGAGMSGLLSAIRLKEAGIPFTILEKNQEVGGTWCENAYPGCRVDIASHFYSYSFEPGHEWTHYFSERPKLFEYFRKVADKYDLRQHIEFGAEVTQARWDEETQNWSLTYKKNSEEKTLSSRFMVNAVGQLNRPKIPDLPGRDKFDGAQMHTAQWDSSVELQGKRIAVVGSGASAFQMVPELAKLDSEITVFQRSPAWMFPNPIYHAPVPDGQRWCMEFLPYYMKWFRFLLFFPGSDGAYQVLRIDPDWEDDGLSISPANRMYRDYLEANMREQIKDPDLLEKVIPDYPPMGKRMLQDNGGWLASLQKDNVQLVSEAVSELTETGLIDSRGEAHDFDIIIWATGFHADRFLWPMDVYGRDGQSLAEVWGDEPKTYLGISSRGFPNMFTLYGPNTNAAHAGSVIFLSECQVKHMMSVIKLMLEQRAESVEVREEVQADYDLRLVELLPTLVWQHPKVNSWYQNKNGRVVSTLPWLLADYWRWTSDADEAEYELS